MLANRVHSIFECLQAQGAEALEIWLPFPEVHDVIRPSVQAPRVQCLTVMTTLCTKLDEVAAQVGELNKSQNPPSHCGHEGFR